ADTYTARTVRVNAAGATTPVGAADVGMAFFPSVDAPPLIGRPFTDADYRQGATPTAMLHYDFWQKRFQGSATIIGQTIQIDGQPTTIVGVMPRGFDFPSGAVLWLPRR